MCFKWAILEGLKSITSFNSNYHNTTVVCYTSSNCTVAYQVMKPSCSLTTSILTVNLSAIFIKELHFTFATGVHPAGSIFVGGAWGCITQHWITVKPSNWRWAHWKWHRISLSAMTIQSSTLWVKLSTMYVCTCVPKWPLPNRPFHSLTNGRMEMPQEQVSKLNFTLRCHLLT